MSENDQENLELELEDEEEGEGEGEKKDKKPELTAEQLEGIERRRLSKLAKKYGFDLKKPEAEKGDKKEEKTDEKKKGFDNADKAYLRAEGIQRDEFDFVRETIENTGKSIDDLLDSKWFQAELKERRDTKATKDAMPQGTKRSKQSSSTDVEYWLAKDELPPQEQSELRRKVVAEKRKRAESRSKFSANPIV